MERIIAYARKSEKPRTCEERSEERGMLSTESQEKVLTELARDRGYKLVAVLEENMSAYKPGRPVFEDMITLIRKGKADRIMVWQLNRLARNSIDAGRIIYLLDEGVLKEIVTPQRRYGNTPEDKFFLQIELANSKKSSDDSGRTIRQNMSTAASKGRYPDRVPLGYLNIDKEGKISGKAFNAKKQLMLEELGRPLKRIEIDPVLGPLMKQLLKEAASGQYRLQELVGLAKRMGLRTRAGQPLVKSTLGKILRNPFYYGAFWYRGELFDENVHHEPLIEREDFDHIQKALSERSFGKSEVHSYGFSGTMLCGECASSITGQSQKGHRYYHCSGWQARFTNGCSQKKYYREEWLEDKVSHDLGKLTLPGEFLNIGLEVLEQNEGEILAQAKTQLATTEKALREAKQKLHNLFQLKISPDNKGGELIDDEEYLTQRKLLKKEVLEAENSILMLKRNDLSWLENCREFFDFARQLQEAFLEGSPSYKKSLLNNLGTILLNHGKLDFKLKEPYSFLVDLGKAITQDFHSPEPENAATLCGKTKLFDPKRSVWWTVVYKIRTYFQTHLFIPPKQC